MHSHMREVWELHLIIVSVWDLLKNAALFIKWPKMHDDASSICTKKDHVMLFAERYAGVGPIGGSAVQYDID